MSEHAAFGFGKFVPGFDFLQNLAKSASTPGGTGASLPGMSNWVAPTLSVEELDKRIQELKAVQFWLEQNSTALKATIQALEVQKMTLSTLQGMNVNMAELAKSFSAHMPAAGAAAASASASANAAPAASAAQPAEPTRPASRPRAAKTAGKAAEKTTASPSAAGKASGQAVDPMQWWGSLTQQFQNIASAAMQDVAAEALKAKTAAAAAPAPAAKKTARKASTAPTGAKRSRSARP